MITKNLYLACLVYQLAISLFLLVDFTGCGA